MARTPCACACVALVAMLAGCAGTPATAPAAPAGPTPAQRLALVEAAGAAGDTELAVRPLRDPATADLRDHAAALLARGAVDDAIAALDTALQVAPGDPVLLQERAEAALLAADYAAAAAFAERAFDAGARVGPLCRRHWATAWQARLALGDHAAADAAQARIEACRLDRPARY